MESQLFTTRNFALEGGEVLPSMTLAYTTYGARGPDSRNAVLLTHGYTSSQHMAGPLRRERRRGLVGRAGRARQGDRYRPAVRRLLEHAGLVLRLDQPRLRQSRHRQALRPGLPRHHPGRHRERAEGAARQARREAPGRGRRAVLRRLPGLPVGRHLSRLHGWAGGRGHRAQGLGRRGGGEVAGRHPGQGSQLERRLVLRQGRRRPAS